LALALDDIGACLRAFVGNLAAPYFEEDILQIQQAIYSVGSRPTRTSRPCGVEAKKLTLESREVLESLTMARPPNKSQCGRHDGCDGYTFVNDLGVYGCGCGGFFTLAETSPRTAAKCRELLRLRHSGEPVADHEVLLQAMIVEEIEILPVQLQGKPNEHAAVFGDEEFGRLGFEDLICDCLSLSGIFAGGRGFDELVAALQRKMTPELVSALERGAISVETVMRM
jgi:hypothetical protein